VKPSYRQEPVPTPTGFTFKELIVVLVIIGALTALLLPAILNAREAARAAQCRGHMSQLKLAVEIYRDTNGRFPPAVFLDEASKVEHSWRVLILPYFANSSLDDYHWD
jgi:prepilin-type N-terminal cleavage/methylation domain-containing protein